STASNATRNKSPSGGSSTASAEEQPSPRADRVEEPRRLDPGGGHLVELHHLVDHQARRTDLALELAPSIEMHLHPRDAPIGHPPVAGRLRSEQDRWETPQKPPPALLVAEVEPDVVRMEREPTTGFENPR